MNTTELLELLENNKEKSLLFEYMPNALVGTNYHITEVKHTKIDSVDCGGQSDAWNETIIQLWESPMEKDKTDYMTALKALGILRKVGKMKPYDLDSEVKFEYSNNHFHTAQLFVNDVQTQGQNLILSLSVQKTDCKAKDICGVPVVEKVMDVAEACCSPESGCC